MHTRMEKWGDVSPGSRGAWSALRRELEPRGSLPKGEGVREPRGGREAAMGAQEVGLSHAAPPPPAFRRTELRRAPVGDRSGQRGCWMPPPVTELGASRASLKT